MSVDFTTTLTPFHATTGQSSAKVKIIFNTIYSDSWDEVNDGDEQGPFPTSPEGDVLAQYVRFNPTGSPTTGGITYTLDGSSLIERDFPIIIGHSEAYGSVYIEYDSTLLNQNYDKFVIVDKETTVNEVGPPEQWTTTTTYGGRATANLLTKSSTGSSSSWGAGYYTFHEQADNKTRVAIYTGGYEYHLQIKPKASSAGDTTAPIISQVTAIPTPSNNATPSYTFTTDEAGTLTTTISQGFSGGSSVSITGTGNQTVTFATLPEYTYSGQTITLTDADGNASTLTIPTFIIDTTNPIITLNGLATITLNKGDIYNEAGATATDNPGSVNLTASITTTGTVNTSVAGTYMVTYNVTDAAGNTATTVTRTVTVTADTTAPIISQITAIPTPSNNATPSYTFTTDEVGTLTTTISQGFSGGSSVSITGTGNQTVTFATLPEYTYSGQTITLTDADGNASTLTIPTFIIDTTNPIITLNGLATITLNKGDIYNEAGATATDNPGSVNLTASITTTGTVNTSVAGTYTVTYNVTDAAGNTATAITRTVTVTALDELTYFWTEYFADASNNIPADSTLIHYGIYNTTKISGVQFTYTTTTDPLTDVSYSIVDNTNNNTMIHKKSWPIHIINNRTNTSSTADDGVANKAMVFAGAVNQTINGMNTGVFAIVKGNVTLASIVAVVDDKSDLLAADQYALGEPANPPEITEPGGRKLGDINFDGAVDGTDNLILEAYLLNDTTTTFTVYDDGTTNNATTGKTAGNIITDMTEYDWQTYVDVNNNNLIDVGDLVRLLSKVADPGFSMTNGT